jgi:hypothetical protein
VYKFSCKYHFGVFKEWQEKNQIVTLKLSEENMKLLNCNLYECQKSSQNQAQANFQTHIIVNEVFVKPENKEISQNSTTYQQQALISAAEVESKKNESEELKVITKTSNTESLNENVNKDKCLA